MANKIKKAFAPIVNLLEANLSLTVEEILPQVVELAAAKTGGGSGGGRASEFHRDEDGNVVAIRCYYHKLWMDPRVVEFGAKKDSATGYNNMCKDGVSKWTKANNAVKKINDDIINEVIAGEIAADQVETVRAERVEEAKTIVPREDGYGFETVEECLADSSARGL